MNGWRTLCRTCGTKINEEFDAKLFDELNYAFLTIIEDITDMLIENDNTLPEFICIRCKYMLEQIAEFRASCLATHKKLLAAIKKSIKSGKEQVPKVNTILDYEEIDVLVEEASNDSCGEQESKEKDNYRESHTEAKVHPSPTQVHEKRLNKTKNINTIHGRTKARTWICEQCGGEFSCSTYLKLHMLRHTGKKEFECDICNSRYYTKNEMQRHKILHTNARPYTCRFCDKSFRGTSSKAVHERTHTNERPFACQYCDKTFTSTSVRKMHERVHVNNRKYHCERCDQWFLRPSHLSLHQRTKLHKNKINGT